ncbi:MAG: carboxyl transferase [Clostridia bacterium]|nr:carboxyl transferase [Clostridia bacterium]
MSIEKVKAELENTVAYKRLNSLFDEGTFSPLAPFALSGNDSAEVAVGFGEVNGCAVYAFAQNSDICAGAMSKAHAAKLKKLYNLALKTGTPVVGLYDSNGARVNEGVEMMTAYGEVLNYSGKLAGIVPQISVVLGPCLGTAALLASCADFVIMSEKGKFTINTDGKGGDAAENKKYGVAAITAKDEFAAIEAAKNLVVMLPQNNLSDPYASEEIPAMPESGLISKFVDGGSFVELFEGFADGAKVGFAKLQGDTVGIVETNGGVIDRHAGEKCAKIVRFCDAYSIPVITLADSKGFKCIKSAAKLTAAYAEATTAKITVVTGEAFGAFYMAVAGTGASTDVTYALENASVSPLNPEAGIIVMAPERLKTDAEGRKKAVEEFKANECSAMRAAEQGYIDNVVTDDELRELLSASLDMLSGKRETTLPKKHSTI